MYRYRYEGGTTRGARARFDRVLKRLGKLRYVKGYRYFGRYQTDHEAVLLRGENGSARFGGLLWGYGGEGPHGTHELLIKIGLSREEADKYAFRTPRKRELGEDWRLTLA
jgi:hypothetical protein